MRANPKERPLDDLILDALPDPVILIDGNRKVVGANKATGGLLGAIYPDEDLSLTLRHPDVLEAVDKVLASGKAEGTEVNFPHPVFRTFEISISSISALPISTRAPRRCSSFMTSPQQGRPKVSGPNSLPMSVTSCAHHWSHLSGFLKPFNLPRKMTLLLATVFCPLWKVRQAG